jgi:3-methyladenine DNA glycosylase AlkD
MTVFDTEWVDTVVQLSRNALSPLQDPTRAIESQRYMKDVAPFLGIPAPDRRNALRGAWAPLSNPTSQELGQGALGLFTLPEREYHYAAFDLIAHWLNVADADFLPTFGSRLLTSTPWWDSVDGLVSAMVSPLCAKYSHGELIDEWSGSGDRWLIRSALGHQRGWKSRTDIDRMCELADEHWRDTEFFIAKAIGWSLRDCARLNPARIERFVVEHLSPNPIAMREIRKGLATAGRRRAPDRP